MSSFSLPLRAGGSHLFFFYSPPNIGPNLLSSPPCTPAKATLFCRHIIPVGRWGSGWRGSSQEMRLFFVNERGHYPYTLDVQFEYQKFEKPARFIILEVKPNVASPTDRGENFLYMFLLMSKPALHKGEGNKQQGLFLARKTYPIYIFYATCLRVVLFARSNGVECTHILNEARDRRPPKRRQFEARIEQTVNRKRDSSFLLQCFDP